ncbi:glycine cleavage system aminomethyltransferase GcvT [Microbacterium excoecariae]|uniref:glycine cleavage system aminomethyltransferase GcvT n=1 Tax=Microbacterium excoecariae TaxID=2715210 RepID=UPI00140CCCA2|nr:glycine cleavage system aminomethyltransferase GcvT [Microbacterium excoecariae]NHI17329.1 glycine cleavage system aminomethyltransferase GcvT [Microbacterium excoecariae]
MSSPPPPLRETPLAAEHAALGATFTDFGGWRMPVRYTSDLAEHRAVRERAGLFDISHMGEILVSGAGAGSFLDAALAGRLSRVAVGRAKYTMILAPDGGIIDDLVIYRLADDAFLVVANAGNREDVAAALAERASGAADVAVDDQSDAYALLALQGPASRRILERMGEIDGAEGLGEVKNYGFAWARFGGSDLLVGRTGYTGEDGFELYVPAALAADLWRALLAAGAEDGLVPAGLAARDTLRLEAGMPLYGHELGRGVVPAQAGLGRIIPADKTGFVGEEATVPRPGARVLVGLSSEGRRAGRAGYAVYAGDRVVGEVTSGALSPTLGHPIAMAYVDPDAVDAALAIDVRGTHIPATRTDLPFYRSQK